jgi:hypothetical protein
MTSQAAARLRAAQIRPFPMGLISRMPRRCCNLSEKWRAISIGQIGFLGPAATLPGIRRLVR